MNTSLLTVASAALTLGLASAPASAIDVHVTGDDWGVWVTGIFDLAANPDDSTHYSFMDAGTGSPMDFMLPLSDGTTLDGQGIESRMISADIAGNVGDDQMRLSGWGVWVTYDEIGVHVTWEAASADGIALDNLGSSGKDGVRYSSGDIDETIVWEVQYADGSVENFTTNFTNFDFTAPVPAPGAAALFGLAGLTATRRRR